MLFMRIHVKITVNKVSIMPKSFGRNKIMKINKRTNGVGIFFDSLSAPQLSFFERYSKLPEAISQNLVGIKKYAAEVLIG